MIKTSVSRPEIFPIKIIPLGGLEQVGMNMTAIEYNKNIIIIDCGMAFADDTLLGIDLIIPDITYLRKNKSRVRALFITHGHEDHIGAIPYIIQDLNIPIYATGLSAALIKRKLNDKNIECTGLVNTVSHGDIIHIRDFDVEFIRTNHSIPDASALAITTPAGVIFHTGDFKVDYTPIYGDAIDLWRFAEIGKSGVLAVISDSTNAYKTGFTMSEKTVGETFEEIFGKYSKKRIVVATFASNVDRVQQIINIAHQYKRKVALDGRSMTEIINTASILGYINIPKNTLIPTELIHKYPDDKVVVIMTGSQGEPFAALSRVANGTHKYISIRDNDVIVFSSHAIPGNEKAVNAVMNKLSELGANVVFQNTHVSGHACQEEIKLVYTLLKPKYIIPMHGEYRHRQANAFIAAEMGYPAKRVPMLSSGDVLYVSEDECKVKGKVQAGGIYVDNSGIPDVGRTIIQDRKDLSEKGVLVVSACIDRRTGQLVALPDVFTRGWVYDGDIDHILGTIKRKIYNNLDKYLKNEEYTRGKVKMIIKESVTQYVNTHSGSIPMILPFITEI